MHTLPELQYKYSDLEPYIDSLTMETHYTKHHQGYVNKLNAALEKYPDLQDKDLTELLADLNNVPEEIRLAVMNNGGGHLNHSLFWQILTPETGQKPEGELADKLEKTFSGIENFKSLFSEKAGSVFGSGWNWLVVDTKGELQIVSTPNQDSPVTLGFKPVLGLDVWEHAYYLKYQNRRPEYIENWWNIVNWEKVSELYSEIV